MIAARHDITIEQGASWRRTLVYRDSNGNPVDLSIYTGARMQVRDKIGGKVYATLTTGNSGIVFTPLAGKIELFIPKSVTSAMRFTEGVYDLFLDRAGDDADRLMQGAVLINRAVTL